jgi:hypothetical protein
MSPQEQILIALQDLDLMLKEATDSQAAFERMGFAVAASKSFARPAPSSPDSSKAPTCSTTNACRSAMAAP